MSVKIAYFFKCQAKITILSSNMPVFTIDGLDEHDEIDGISNLAKLLGMRLSSSLYKNDYAITFAGFPKLSIS